jgi:hypothetical protein
MMRCAQKRPRGDAEALQGCCRIEDGSLIPATAQVNCCGKGRCGVMSKLLGKGTILVTCVRSYLCS